MAENKKGGMGKAILAAGAAAAAGYYFYASKDAGTHRKVATKWAGELKSDVVKRAKNLKNIDRKTMMGVVDTATKAYASARNLDRKELAKAAGELKMHWEKIAKELNASGKKVAHTAAKKVKSQAKKVVKAAKKKASN